MEKQQQLCLHIKKWLHFNSEKRQKHLKDLIKHLQVEQFTIDFIKKEILSDTLLCSDREFLRKTHLQTIEISNQSKGPENSIKTNVVPGGTFKAVTC